MVFNPYNSWGDEEQTDEQVSVEFSPQSDMSINGREDS